MSEIIARFEKNALEEIRVTIQEWKSQPYVDIRVFILQQADKSEGAIATKKGITLSVELLPELRKAIDKALAKVELEDKSITDQGQE